VADLDSDSAEEKTRLNLIYDGTEVKERIERIMRLGSHSTMTSAVATALRVYKFILDEQSKDNQILIRDKNGKTERILV
jgi:hypothetical protein